MELNQLRTFVAVAEMGHLTQAAERLHMSQPAASAHIKALELALGVTLFERRASGLALTLGGQELLASAREVLAASTALRNKAREITRSVVGKFCLGVRVDSTSVPLGDLVRATRQRHPKLEMEIRQLNSLTVVSGIQSGELDAGFGLSRGLPPGLVGLDLRPVMYCVVAPAEWKERIAGVDLAGLLKLPWISAPRGGSYDQMLLALFGEASLSLNRVVDVVVQEPVHATLCEAGVGLTLMCEDRAYAAQERGALTVWQGSSVPTTLRYIYAERRARDPAIQAIREIAKKIWNLGPGDPPAAAYGTASNR